MSTSFWMEAVDRLDDRHFQRSADERGNRFRCYAHEVRMLAEAIDERLRLRPSMTWYDRAADDDAVNDRDIKACLSAVAVRRELDEIERLLTTHLSKLPVYTFFWWRNDRGEQAGSEVVEGFVDGQVLRLRGGWEASHLETMSDGRWVRSPLTAASIRLNVIATDGPQRDISIERRTFLTYYLPILNGMRDICSKALARDGLVFCAVIH